jgi:hypothetical protein
MNWYLSRLSSMQPSEVLWRARHAARVPFDWLAFKRNAQPPAADYRPFNPATYPVRLHDHGSRLDRIRIFDLDFPIETAFDWHRDYRYGKTVDRRFSGALNIRDTAAVGDIKYIWEISRHQYLSALAFAANGNDEAGWIVATLTSWLGENPLLCGVNWTSSLELGLRLISWSLLYPRIASTVDREVVFRDRWLASIYFHLKRIASNLSRYSSANNHLIGELAGLYVGASCFPFWRECTQWRASAKRELEREILLQVAEDGVNREQAMSYHLFTLELFLAAFIVGRNTGDSFGEPFTQRLRAMLAFLDSAATPGGDLPWYGDSDDARGFLFAQDESALQVVSQLGALLFHEPAWSRFLDRPTAAAQALLPDLLDTQWQSDGQSMITRQEIFRDGGLAFVRSKNGAVSMMMDFGPLGYTTIAAHGHADALSIGLAVDDEYFLVDSGTFSYHSHPEWRNYFRGTAAHNTARIDGEDQSCIAGRFLWSRKANARLLRWEDSSHEVVLEAEQDGYARLEDPVIHQRCAVFNRNTGSLRLEDTFRCAADHQVELFFHMHEDSQVSTIEPGHAEVEWRGHRITFTSPAPFLKWSVIRGSEDPQLGWRSRAFNHKQPISTLRLAGTITKTTTITLDITVDT